jgi:hypothetical protein
MHQETMEFLLGSPHFHLDFRDRYVIAYRKKPFKVADFEAAIQVITGILDRLPESVVQELKATPAPCPNCEDQSPAAHGFCQNCGAAITSATGICVNCGARVGGETQGSKSKTASVLLAVFLAYWTWLYTYKKDKWKFWVGLALSIVLSVFVFATFGLGAFLIWPVWVGIWIWAIVDVAVKKDKWYRSY